MIGLVRRGTPIEPYYLGCGRRVWVKREDLCVDEAHFSKLRGVAAHLESIQSSVIGVLDTAHSKAGWGVTYIARSLGKRVVAYYPCYKGEINLRENQRNAERLGAELVPLPAGRSCILYHWSKADLQIRYPADSYMMPNALKLEESVQETALEVSTVPGVFFQDSCVWVVSASSGTLAAGVIRGLYWASSKAKVIVHLGYSRPSSAVLRYLYGKSGGFPGIPNVELVDEGYQYKDLVSAETPFPCNPYYDLKAWKWLNNNPAVLNGCSRVLFWNIG